MGSKSWSRNLTKRSFYSSFSQLRQENIETRCVVVAEGGRSGFTYIIIDALGEIVHKTRIRIL